MMNLGSYSSRGGTAAIPRCRRLAKTALTAAAITAAAFAANAADSTIDATAGITATDAQKNLLQDGADGGTVTVTGAGDKGLTVTLDNQKTLTTHIVFDGGVHNLSSVNGGGYTICDNSSFENPMWLVKTGTTLNFTGKDFGGWTGDVLDKCVIAVENGGTINLVNDGTATFYVRNRWYLNPGSTLNINGSSDDRFRVIGGTASGKEQFYVPAGGGTATIGGSRPIRLPGDNTKGFAAFVGEGSTLALNVALNSDNATDRPFVKRGEGTIEFNGDIANMKSDVTIEAGTARIGSSPFGGKVKVEGGAVLEFNPNRSVVNFAGEVAVSGSVVVDDASANHSGAVTLANVTGSGTFSVVNGALYLPVTYEPTLAEGTKVDETGAITGYRKYVNSSYVAEPVAIVGEEKFYTVEKAFQLLDGAAGTVKLLTDATENVTLATGQVLDTDGKLIGTVSAAANTIVGFVNGVYTAYANNTDVGETWTGNGDDNRWKNAANWSLGFVPLKTTPVTIPETGATIAIVDHNESETCASLVLNGDLTLTYGSSGGWPVLYFYDNGGVSGTGTLTLSRDCLENKSSGELEISTPLVIATDSRGDSSLLGDNGWKVSGPLTIQDNGILIVRNHALTVTGPTTLEQGAKLGLQAQMAFNGDTTFKGDFIRQEGENPVTFGNVTVAESTKIPGGATFTINGAVTVNEGKVLTLDGSTQLGDGATFALAGPGSGVIDNPKKLNADKVTVPEGYELFNAGVVWCILADITWTPAEGGDSDWGTAANWSPNGVPTVFNRVVINGDATLKNKNNARYACGPIAMNGNVAFVGSDGQSEIQVYGDITGSGTLTIRGAGPKNAAGTGVIDANINVVFEDGTKNNGDAYTSWMSNGVVINGDASFGNRLASWDARNVIKGTTTFREATFATNGGGADLVFGPIHVTNDLALNKGGPKIVLNGKVTIDTNKTLTIETDDAGKVQIDDGAEFALDGVGATLVDSAGKIDAGKVKLSDRAPETWVLDTTTDGDKKIYKVRSTIGLTVLVF